MFTTIWAALVSVGTYFQNGLNGCCSKSAQATPAHESKAEAVVPKAAIPAAPEAGPGSMNHSVQVNIAINTPNRNQGHAQSQGRHRRAHSHLRLANGPVDDLNGDETSQAFVEATEPGLYMHSHFRPRHFHTQKRLERMGVETDLDAAMGAEAELEEITAGGPAHRGHLMALS